MSRIKSLRYLILDTLNKKNVKSIDKKKISQSLSVFEENNFYKLTWKEDLKLKELKLDKKDFEFYSRNDLNQDLNKNSLKKNNDSAIKVVDQIIPGNYIVKNTKNSLKKELTCFFYFFISYSAVFLSFQNNNQIQLFVVFIIFLSEIIFKNKNISLIFFLIISFFMPGKIIFFISLLYLILQLVEDLFNYKNLNTLILPLILYYNYQFIDFEIFKMNINLTFTLIVFLFVLINNFFRYNSRHSWLYILPTISLAVYDENNLIFSLAILFFSYFYFIFIKLLRTF